MEHKLVTLHSLVLLASNDPENDDCDGDGLTDAEEFNADPMTDPGNPDTDGDGLLDNEDAEPTTFNDSDGDGVGDGFDVCPGHDDNVDADGDGTPAGCDADDTDDTVQ